MKMILDYGVMEIPELKPMDSDSFLEFCQLNPDMNLELDRHGNIHAMSPVFGKGANYEAETVLVLGNWNIRAGRPGYIFSSQGGFTLPNGAVRAADAAWVEKSKMDALLNSEWDKFPHICPDFIIEIRSKSDRIKPLHDKMEEYMENGARLGFLIDPYDKISWIYRAGVEAEKVVGLDGVLGGEEVLPGFELELSLFK